MKIHDDRSEEVRNAQIRILEKYGLILDLSRLEEGIIYNINHGDLPSVEEGVTWSKWCKEVFSSTVQPNVASFDYVSGQTRFSTVKERAEHSSGLKLLSGSLLRGNGFVLRGDANVIGVR